MAEEQTQTTLRDVIADQINKLEEAPAPEVIEPTTSTVEPAITGDRSRDDQGRFLPKEETKVDVIVDGKPRVPTVTQQVREPLNRPSAWAKEYWGHWDKLTKGEPLSADEAYALAQYNLKRESDYAKGVSVYKTEYDRAKPLVDAIAPFMPDLQQNNVNPAHWITNLGNAHTMLLRGDPQQKLAMFIRLAQDYKIPLEQMVTQGQDGRLYFNPSVQAYQPPPQQPDVRGVVQDVLMQEKAQQELAEFQKNVSEKYPNYEAVKETMARLLDSGFSTSLESAYETALKMPEHAELYAKSLQEKAEKDKQAQADKIKAETERARRNTVSTGSRTPSVPKAGDKPRSIRDSVSEAFDQHLPGERV